MKYFERNETSLQGEKDILDKQASEWGVDANMLYLQPGSSMVRILPPYSEAGVFFRRVTKHRVRVGTRTEILACPAAEANMACPICEKGQELTDTKDEAKMKFARDNLRPRTQYLYNVLVHSSPANRKGELTEFGTVYVMEAGVMVHRQIIGLDQDPIAGWNDLTNPETGVNLIIKRTGQGLDTKYEVNPHGQGRTDIFADCSSKGIDPASLQMINLDEVYTLPPAEKLAEVASSIVVGGAFPGASANPRPALQTVSPAAAAAPAAPQPVAGPAPQPVSPAPQPVAPVAEAAAVPQPPAVPAPPE